MKYIALVLVSLFIQASNTTSQFEKIIKIIPTNWSYTEENNLLIITRKDSVEIKYCGLNPMKHEPIYIRSYRIIIESLSKISDAEIKKRSFLQDSILAEYERKYKLKPNMENYSDRESFRYYRNNIDTLRIPFYNDNQYSYFMKNNLQYTICVFNDETSKEITGFEEAIRGIK
jgi:hypothetical protein